MKKATRSLGVVLLCGWVLMRPPVKDGLKLDPLIPARDWTHVSSYDNASACEADKKANVDRLAKDNNPLSLVWSMALCIPADYIYPAKRGEQ